MSDTQERQVKLSTAQKKWAEVVNDLRLESQYRAYALHELATEICYLSLAAKSTRGVGKGKSQAEMQVSAQYEALEYYLSGHHYHPQSHIIGSVNELSHEYSLLFHRCDLSKVNNLDADNAKLPWIIYKNIIDQQPFAVPLAAADLSYEISNLKEQGHNFSECHMYSASNGLASGATYEEAVVHGALEVIERDAYSYFLIDTFLLNKAPIIVNVDSLPEHLKELVKTIEARYQNQVLILRMPSRFGAYCYLASLVNPELEIQPRGGGASLDKHYAIERALYELIQSYNLMHGDFNENVINSDKTDEMGLIKQFLTLDLRNRINLGQIEIENASLGATNHPPTDIHDYLKQLIARIQQCSTSLLVNQAYQHPNGLSCVRVIIPDAEEFFLATHYMKLDPTPTTQMYIQSHTATTFAWENSTLAHQEKNYG